VVDGGVNFSLYSRNATGVELLFFDLDDDVRPARLVRLDPVANHTFHYWHHTRRQITPAVLFCMTALLSVTILAEPVTSISGI
jgi:glycogen operon protein